MCSKKALVVTVRCCWAPLGALGWVLTQVLTRVTAGRRCSIGCCWALLGTARRICANFANCSWEPLTMFNPHFVAGEHGLFGGHKSEDIFFSTMKNHVTINYSNLILFDIENNHEFQSHSCY